MLLSSFFLDKVITGLMLAHSLIATPGWIITVGFVLHADTDILVHTGEHVIKAVYLSAEW